MADCHDAVLSPLCNQVTKIISQAEAKAAGLKRYFIGIPCIHGHISERNVGIRNECIECKRIRDCAYALRTKARKSDYDKEYRKKNFERRQATAAVWRSENREKNNKILRDWYAANKQRVAEYRAKNREKRNSQKREWNVLNRDRIREYARVEGSRRKAEDINYRIACALRTRLAVAVRAGEVFRAGGRVGSAIRDLGCSIQDLKEYLERQFLPGMSWDNWGRKGWHIDHERPLSSFDLTDQEQVARACHYTNLRPLWAFDNLSKGANWPQAGKLASITGADVPSQQSGRMPRGLNETQDGGIERQSLCGSGRRQADLFG